MGGGNVGEGVVMDLARFSQPLNIDPSSRTATTGAAVTLAELNAAAAKSWSAAATGSLEWRLGHARRHGLHQRRRRTIGSVRQCAALGSGAHADHGRCRTGCSPKRRRWATEQGKSVGPLRPGCSSPASRRRSTHLQRGSPGSGRTLPAMPSTPISASGDVLDLIVGAEGTLGIVTEIEWRLDPVPECRAGMRVQLPSLDHLHNGGRGASIGMSLLRWSCSTGASSILWARRIEWPPVSVQRSRPSCWSNSSEISRTHCGRRSRSPKRAALPWAVSIDIAYSGDADRLWAIRHAASPILAGLPEDRRSLQVIEDACVPIETDGRVHRHRSGAWPRSWSCRSCCSVTPATGTSTSICSPSSPVPDGRTAWPLSSRM